jgi:acetoin utilization protein AcuB
MQVRDVMSSRVLTAGREETATAVWERLRAARSAYLVVVTKDGKVAGTLSAQDLSGPAGGGHRRMGRTVADLMRRDVVTATPATTVARAAAMMRKNRVGCLPVMNRGKLVGLLTIDEMLGILMKAR